MTRFTFQLEMFAFKLERALLMRFAGEQRRLELGFVMAGVAVGARRASFELAAMNVLVAITAQPMGHRSPEIIILVALGTSAVRMFAMQRKLTLVVIETASRQDRLPAGGRMATLARALERRVLECAAMLIGMAILTAGEGETFVPCGRFSRLGTVTLHTCHVLMKPCERVCASKMVEPFGRLPGFLIVAAKAFSTKLASVRILMATLAFLSQAQESLVKVFDLDLTASGRGNMAWVMALLAFQLCVLPFESKSREPAMLIFLGI